MMNLLFGTPFTVSTHSRPKAAGTNFIAWARAFVFQLTAARRRLVNMEARQKGAEAVSTHSRPKAAGWIRKQQALALKRFNSQPPEGGWDDGEVVIVGQQFRFNSQPPEGGWRIQYFSIYNAAMFQLTAARRRLGARRTKSGARKSFQLTAARRRLGEPKPLPPPAPKFQLTAARRRLVYNVLGGAGGGVSTHSRPKAAGYRDLPLLIERLVSTHSRPKAAGQKIAGLNRTSKFQLTAARRRLGPILFMWVVLRCFNSQPPEGGWPSSQPSAHSFRVSTHSRPKAAGCRYGRHAAIRGRFQLTAARRRLVNSGVRTCCHWWFQLTAARRRLGDFVTRHPPRGKVSTHSRPKAAGEGLGNPALVAAMFQLTAARRRLAFFALFFLEMTMFQLTAARRRLDKRPRAPARRRGFNSQPPEGGWPVRTTRRNPWEGFNSQPPEGGWQRARAIR